MFILLKHKLFCCDMHKDNRKNTAVTVLPVHKHKFAWRHIRTKYLKTDFSDYCLLPN